MDKQKIVVLGAGFAGLRFVKKMMTAPHFEITLIDRLNFHQFQPLLYQVATSGLEPSAISFPLRKALHKENIRIRLGEAYRIDPGQKTVFTTAGQYTYDRLVIALGTDTNFFGNKILEKHCLTMKSVPESIELQNQLLSNYEQAVVSDDIQVRDACMNIVIVGGGATGVELAGAIAEMKTTVLQKDYPELDFSRMKIHLIEAGNRLLPALSGSSSEKTLRYLTKLGVEVMLNTSVESYDGQNIETSDVAMSSKCVIWTAGVKANSIEGLDKDKLGKGGRILTDAYGKVCEGIYAIGDIAFVAEAKYPGGHPQVAPVAMQQADNLAYNILCELRNRPLRPFRYKNKGNMATVGRNLAIVELGNMRLGGFPAWLLWMSVHLMSILGVKNKVWVFFSWLWKYITYDLSLRLIMKQPEKKCDDNK